MHFFHLEFVLASIENSNVESLNLLYTFLLNFALTKTIGKKYTNVKYFN